MITGSYTKRIFVTGSSSWELDDPSQTGVVWNPQNEHIKIIVECGYCDTRNKISNPRCIACGASLKNAKIVAYE